MALSSRMRRTASPSTWALMKPNGVASQPSLIAGQQLGRLAGAPGEDGVGRLGRVLQVQIAGDGLEDGAGVVGPAGPSQVDLAGSPHAVLRRKPATPAWATAGRLPCR